MLRLESATIALHDEVEAEVKASIAKEEREEERVLQDALIIDNETERGIRYEVMKGVEKEDKIKPGKKVKNAQRRRVKSSVSRPDIRNWLSNKSTSSRKEEVIPEVIVISEEETEPKTRVKSKVSQPDLRSWLSKKSSEESLEDRSNKSTSSRKEEVIPEVILISEEETEPKTRVKSRVSQPDLRS